jgi:ubiquinone/menaquinone biosynthesis C-methylase UbiE
MGCYPETSILSFGDGNLLKPSLDLFYLLFPKVRRSINRRWYEYISALDQEGIMPFMNYGYVDTQINAANLPLQAADEPYRYAIQLYHHVAGRLDLNGLKMLEVGSGRGGGASYVMRYLKPKSLVGVDITANAIAFCRRQYHLPGLTFIQGNAEALEFDDRSFDVVINVESSHCYPHIDRFFAEVVRVLKPGGHFLYADFREAKAEAAWRQQLLQTGLRWLTEADITGQVVTALELDDARKGSIRARAPPEAPRPRERARRCSEWRSRWRAPTSCGRV